MKQILIILGLFASVTTFAQSPRIKLNQITKDSVTGSVLISSPTDSGMVYSRDLFISYGADTVLILYGDTLAATSGIISSVLSDGVTITGNGTTGNELKVDTSLIATISALNDSLATISASTTPDGVTITGDGSVGNPLKVDTLLISTIQGLVDTLTARGYLTAEVDGSITNELQTISTSGAAGNITLSDGGGTLNLNVDDADASASNEGSLTVGAGTASTSVISSNTSGSTDVTLTAGTNVTLSETGNNITISATGGGTTYNNISETADTVYISDYLDVDTSTLYVDATNNRVGIGTSSPQGTFHFKGGIVLEDTDSLYAFDNLFNVIGPGQVGAGANGSEFSFGVRGVGSTGTNQGPAFAMRGNNFTRFSGERGAISFLAGTVSSPTSKDGTILFYTNSAVQMEIEADGDVVMSNDAYINGIVPVTSDFNLKNNINDYNAGLDKIMKLRSVSFYLNNDKNNSLNFGYIAQEVQDILPELIRQNNNNGYLYLVYENFIPIITNAIQEQQTIIEAQATAIEQLKSQIQLILSEIEQIKNN